MQFVTRLGAFSVLAACMIVFCTLHGCDVFSVRDSEPPVESAPEDVLDFANILDGTDEYFSRLNYTDLFTEGAVYRQGTNPKHTRDALVARLRYIERQYPLITVEWQLNPYVEPRFSRQEGDTVHLDSATYLVYISGERTDTPDYTGHSDIGLVYVDYWAICYWHDFPDTTNADGYSFFNPDFFANASDG